LSEGQKGLLVLARLVRAYPSLYRNVASFGHVRPSRHSSSCTHSTFCLPLRSSGAIPPRFTHCFFVALALILWCFYTTLVLASLHHSTRLFPNCRCSRSPMC
jgi:hypothetical protein